MVSVYFLKAVHSKIQSFKGTVFGWKLTHTKFGEELKGYMEVKEVESHCATGRQQTLP